jgi:hypothetical protein
MGEKRNICRVLVGKVGGMRALGTPKYMCMDNIEMELRGLEWG